MPEADPPVVEVAVGKEIWADVVDGSVGRRLLERGADLAARVRASMIGELGLMAFDDGPSGTDDPVVFPEALPARANLWFIGDLHGDLLALECALRYIAAYEPDRPSLVAFLGDLIDDGPHSLEVVLRLYELIATRPRSVCLLAGNHDEALVWNAERRGFASAVTPSEWSVQLNAAPDDKTAHLVATTFIDVVANARRAVFLPDGLVVAHGGIPQADLWPTLTSREAFQQPLCLQDFVWTRAHPRAARRVPSRLSRGAEFGRDDFADFCELAETITGRPVKRMIRGHDHVAERFDLYPKYRRRRLVTINTLSRRLPREWGGPPVRVPCIARWRENALPEIHRLLIPEEIVLRMYPEARASEERPQAAVPVDRGREI